MRTKASFILLMLLLLPFASASEVGFENENGLNEQGLNIRAGEVSPGGQSILLVGDDGYIHMISASKPGDRNQDQSIDSSRSARFNDVSWHPNGQTALIAGDLGGALRYTLSDNSIKAVNGAGSVGSNELTAISWRAGGDLAFFGAKNGNIYSFNEGEGMSQLGGTMESEITDIACHLEHNLCLASTLNDGIAVIDRTREVTWLDGTSSKTWVAVDCPDSAFRKCVAFGSGRVHVSIVLDIEDASKSTIEQVLELREGTTEFIAASRGYDGTSLVHLAPMESVRFKTSLDEVFMHMESQAITDYDPEVAGQRIALMWEIGEDDGWMITNQGLIIKIYPTDGVEIVGGMVIMGWVVVISVVGTVVGLIFMNSPYLQRKYRQLRGFEKKD